MTLPAEDASRICALVSGSAEQPRLPRPALRRMGRFMNSPVRPVLLSLVFAAVPLAAQTAAPPPRPVPIEAVSAMPVATVLPSRLLSGPGWRVSQNAPTDGYSGLYNLETEYGSFGCLGIEMLETRVRELYAIRELDRVSQALTGRIRQLAERYATPLPLMQDELAALEAKVARHLASMGFANAY